MFNRLTANEFSLSAVIVANILIELLDDNDIFTLGNFLMLMSQYLQTYSAQQVFLETLNNNEAETEKDQSSSSEV